MPIKQVPAPNKDLLPKADNGNEQQGPLLQIDLPAPASGDPMAPLPIGQHNASAQKNFKRVADLFLAVINNQKSISAVIVEQGKSIKTLEDNNKKLAENIRKLLKENNYNGKSKPTKRN